MKQTAGPSANVRQLFSQIRALAHRPTRERTGRYWIEGIRQFIQAYDAHQPFDAIVYCSKLLKSGIVRALVRRLTASCVPTAEVSPEQFRSVSALERACGIGAVLRQRWMPLEKAHGKAGLCWLVIEQIRSPGNLGTIL